MSKKLIVDQLLDDGSAETAAQADKMVDDVFRAVQNLVEHGETVRIIGFGSFKKVQRKGRIGRNPTTGQAMTIPARERIVFKQPRGAA